MQFLKLARFSPNGAYLVDSDANEVLLPKRYLNDCKIGAQIWVFVSTDSEDRLIASTECPKAFVGDIALLEVCDISNNGIYLDIGLSKDIFMPSKNPTKYKIGSKIVVKITLDKQNRMLARANIADFLSPAPKSLEKKNINFLPFLKTPLGLNCVVGEKYFGLIHNNDINCALEIGVLARGFIKKVRADGKCDIGIKNDMSEIKAKVLELARELGLDLDKVSEETKNEIISRLKISKKALKRALGEIRKNN